jgi:hypothetical protein
VRDHQHGDLARARHRAQHAQHLVGLGRRQDRGGLVQDHEATAQVELLEDLDLLLLTGGQARDRAVEVEAERDGGHEGGQLIRFRTPVDDRGDLVARHHEVLRHRHARHQREVLVHHPDSERVRVVRRPDVALAAAHDDLARVRLVIADETFHERALAGAVLAEQRGERARLDSHGDVVERGEGAETFGHAKHLDVDRARLAARRRAGELGHAGP